MAEKLSFKEAFFPPNPVGNQVIFGDENKSTFQEQLFGSPEPVSDGNPEEPQVSSEGQKTPDKIKKEPRRSRPSSLNEKEILNEARHWKSSYLQESEKARAIEQENFALQLRLEEADEARRQSERKALSEREDNLRMQMKVARAAGEDSYADEVSGVLNQALIQKELQAYDHYKSSTNAQNNNSHYTPERIQQPQEVSPIERQRQDAFDEFCYRNPWYGKNPSLTNLTNQAMEQFINVLQLENQDAAIYSPEFFGVLEDEIKSTYGLTAPVNNSNQPQHKQNNQVSTRFSDVPRGNMSMAEQYAASQGRGQAYSPEQVRKSGVNNLEIKVGSEWVHPSQARELIEKNRSRIRPINNGFQIEFK